jgi:hypothetical protein
MLVKCPLAINKALLHLSSNLSNRFNTAVESYKLHELNSRRLARILGLIERRQHQFSTVVSGRKSAQVQIVEIGMVENVTSADTAQRIVVKSRLNIFSKNLSTNSTCNSSIPGGER